LVGKPEGKRPLGRPRRRWDDGIKMSFREISWECLEWIYLAQDRGRWRALVNTVMNLPVWLHGVSVSVVVIVSSSSSGSSPLVFIVIMAVTVVVVAAVHAFVGCRLLTQNKQDSCTNRVNTVHKYIGLILI
jgi:hypothetical protein